ncbi:MAG: hypothetical protein CMG46_12850 [Candidatus Marinimicrobia bacterium]|nr:hypothetical protein [Candidatus Neomarinimicrobiota bacterium]
MSSALEKVVLSWEDKDPSSHQWWLARAQEPAGRKRDFFIAEDKIAGYLIGLVRYPPAVNYKVIAATPLTTSPVSSSGTAEVKAAVAGWIASGQRENIWLWRIARLSKMIWNQLPIIAAGFFLGTLIGFLVSFVAESSGLMGWPMMVVGGLIGAGSGPVLKFILDCCPESKVNGPWTRLIVITLSAIFGSVIAAGILFNLF